MNRELLEKIKEHYWACHLCMTDAGGEYPEGHVCTVTAGKCKICGEKATLIPWVDYNWKGDTTTDYVAKTCRD